MDKTYLLVGEEQRGPYSEKEIRDQYTSGAITHDTLHWKEGMAEWQPLGRFSDAEVESRAPKTIAPPRRTQGPGKAVSYSLNPKDTMHLSQDLSARRKPITVPKAFAFLVIFLVIFTGVVWVVSKTVPDAGKMFKDRVLQIDESK